MPSPDMNAVARLDISDFRKNAQGMLADLRTLHDVSKKIGTIRITADLSALKDVQRVTASAFADLKAQPSEIQDRISKMFGQFVVGAVSAKQSAAAFEAETASLKAQIDQLTRSVSITKETFRLGFGDPSQKEIEAFTADMNRLQSELSELEVTAKKTFGETSREVLQLVRAGALATNAVAAVNGEVGRLTLASQVKLGVGDALTQYGGQANYAALGLLALVKSSEQARISALLFEKTLAQQGAQAAKVREDLALLADTYNIVPAAAESTFKSLSRSQYTADQAAKIIELYAAIATVKGEDISRAMEALATDVERGSTVMSNFLGISTDQIASQEKYARSINKTREQLTGAEKAQAFLNAVMREEGDALTQAREALQGYGGAMGELNKEMRSAQQNLGQALLPVVLNTTRALVGLLEAYNQSGPVVKGVTTILLASAVTLGLLAAPLAGVRQLMDILGLTSRGAAKGVEAAAEATTALNNASKASALTRLIEWVKAAPAAWAAYRTSVLAASGANTIFQASALRLMGTQLVAWLGTAAAATLGLAAGITAAVGSAVVVGFVANKIVRDTTAIYASADEANQKSFEAVQARITQLAKSGSELDRAKARYLNTFQALQQAQEAPVVGINLITGERIYGPKDEERIKKLQGDLVDARQEVTTLFTEAQRRGQVNLKLTQDQTKAVKELTKTLEGRQFDLKIEGLSEMGADLARLGKEFDDLKIKFKAPFTVNGKLMDPAQTPALRQGLAQIDTQRLAEEAAVRAKYAREAAAAARKAALDTQSAEIEAMRDGAAKRTAERRAEIAQIQQAAKEEAARYADFPKQQAAIESEARRTIAAKRKLWAREDQDLSKEEAKKAQEQAATTAARILEAEQAAQAAQIAAMADGRAKKEAQRQAELEELKASIAQKVAALADDPEAQAAQRASGETQVAAKLTEQSRQRAQEERDAQQQVTEARRTAREAELAAIKDEGQRIRAQRELEVEDYRAAVQRRLDALKGYPEKQAAVLAAARTQTQALERRWAQEDVERAKATAQRVADAWLKAQGAQFQAQEATRDAEAAGFELRLSRQLAAAQGNALRVAKLEAGAIQERARLAENAAQARYDNERKTLRTNLDRALADEKLTASERRAMWAAYYADLNQLAAAFQADERKRQQQREQEEREAAARLALLPARQALQGADTRVKEAEWRRELAVGTQAQLEADAALYRSHRERLAALQQILATTQAQNRPQEEQKKAADDVAEAQHQIALDMKAQLDTARQLSREAYQRRQDEAAYAEATARTDAQVLDARLARLGNMQARLAELAGQLTTLPAGQERDGVLQEWRQASQEILALQDQIAAMPTQAEQRRVALLQAQRALLLEQVGLGDDRVAQAQQAVITAEEEVRQAEQQLSLARTQAELDTARTELAQKRTGALAAERELIKARNDEENRALDVREAQARALLQLRDLGDDALATAQLDLDLTRQKLALVGGQLARGGLGTGDILALQKQQIELLGQQAQQERALAQAQRDQADLYAGLEEAQRRLRLEQQGGAASTRSMGAALEGVASARAALVRAERDYQLAVARGRPEALKTATEGLTAAIKGQREALTGLAEEYRKQIAGMEGVQAAAARLDKVAYGDAGRKYDFNRENERLQAIQARRDAAQVALANALQSGQKDQIAEAADALAKQEERYKKQADLMEKNGSQINRTGEKATQKLADQVDRLGIQYDREILNLQERARVVDREAEAVVLFGQHVERFQAAAQSLLLAPPSPRAAAPPAATEAELERQRREEATRRRLAEQQYQDTLRFNLQSIKVRGPDGRLIYDGAAFYPPEGAGTATVKLDQSSLQALSGLRPDPASALADQGQFAEWLRQHQGAATMAAPTYITNVEVGEIIVKPPPGSDIKRVARAVKAELFDEARKSGKGMCWP